MSFHKQHKIARDLASARTLHQNNQIALAIVAYKKILRAVPNHPDALHYLGLACYQTGQIEVAESLIQRAIALAPQYLDAMNNLANIFQQTERAVEAQALYQQVLCVAPDHTNALINMAVLLREFRRPEEALTFIQRGLLFAPDHVIARYTLGNIYADLQQFTQAEEAYRQVLAQNPRQLLAAKRLAYVLQKTSRLEEAISILQSVLKQHPDDPVAQHLLAAYSHNDVPARASDPYIKQTFDDYSAHFDQALAQLQYQVPMLIGQRLETCLKPPAAAVDILDLGCGTGLCAAFVKPVARLLVGVDLSCKMLAKAMRLRQYDELHEAELGDYLRGCSRQFQLVICADTLVYFGELQQVFAAVYRVLPQGGYFIFSLEQLRESTMPYQLQPTGRYSHRQSYVIAALQAAGFSSCQAEDIVPRLESGDPVDGALYTAQT